MYLLKNSSNGNGRRKGNGNTCSNHKPEDAVVQLMFRLSCRATSDSGILCGHIT